MFEIYAVIASLLLPTGLISLVHLLWNIQNKKPLILWTMILDCIVTILLGIFYTYCAIILSQTSVTSEETHLMVNNNDVDDIAIINDTFYNDFQSATFYNKIEPIRLDETNEVEDSRNNKEKADPSKFFKNYQYLIQTEIDRQRLQNGTDQEGTPYQRMRYSASHMELPHKMDTLENSDCFLRFFFYRSLFVYSFITCALSLLNTCHLSKQYFINEKPLTTEETTKIDNPSEQFGEKILDNISDSSSENAVPVGPLFDEDSMHKTAPNLDVFNVKSKAEDNRTTERSWSRQTTLKTKKECNTFTVVTCVNMLILPAVFVAILYIMMRSAYTSNLAAAPPPLYKVTFPDLLSTFNITSSDTGTVVNLVTEQYVNGTYQNDMESVLRRVYDVINKFKDERNESTNILLPTIRGQYPLNCTEDFLGDKTNLKTFNFVVFVVLFFAVILYSKLSETNMSTNTSTQIWNRYTLAFVILWTPNILDMVVSMFITNREPDVISSLLLIVGNMNRLYSSIQNFCSLKWYRNSSSGSIKPVS